MHEFRRILVATDTRLEEHPIVEEAAEIALLSGATLKIVDGVKDFSWTVRLTMSDHEHVHELMIQEKEAALESLAKPLRDRGLQVETKVLSGKTSVEIIREVIRADHDLVMRVAKGKDSRAHGFFGSTGTRLLRECPCAVWLVSPATTPKFTHVLACIDTSSGEELDARLNKRVYELAEAISKYHGGRFSVVHAWSIWNEQMLKGRMGEELFEQVEHNNEKQVTQMLDSFLEQYQTDSTSDHVHLLKGEPAEVIAKLTWEDNVDLVVMGTVARSGITGMVMGNSAEKILNRIQCSVLALKPEGFISPVKVEGA